MFKYANDINLMGYGLYFNKMSTDTDSTGNTTFNLEFTMQFGDPYETQIENIDRFALDLRMMNNLRNNTNPAVQKHYEELLILMNLSQPQENDDVTG